MKNAFIQKRNLKQLLVSSVFLAILVLGWGFPWLGYFIPLCMIAGMGIGLSRGRRWCDWYCPRGSFYDALIRPFSPQRPIPGIFRSIYFRSVILILLMIIMLANVILRWPDAHKIGLFFIIMLTTTSVLGIILGLIFQHRCWCVICPIGTIVNFTSRPKRGLTIDSGLCIECKNCRQVCPVQIKPDQYKSQGLQKIGDRDCLKCRCCVSVCPKMALSL
jgi:ferredoxin-type protein NapH